MPLEQSLKPFAIDPAALRHRIELRRLRFDETKPWEEAQASEPLATLWAAILSQSSVEEERADQLHTAGRLQCVIRHRADLASLSADQIALHHQGRVFDLTSIVDPDQRGRWLILDAKRKVGA